MRIFRQERWNKAAVWGRVAFAVEFGFTPSPSIKSVPDGFLAAMVHFGVDAGETIVFEAAPEGIEAAHRAAVQCVAVPRIE